MVRAITPTYALIPLRLILRHSVINRRLQLDLKQSVQSNQSIKALLSQTTVYWLRWAIIATFCKAFRESEVYVNGLLHNVSSLIDSHNPEAFLLSQAAHAPPLPSVSEGVTIKRVAIYLALKSSCQIILIKTTLSTDVLHSIFQTYQVYARKLDLGFEKPVFRSLPKVRYNDVFFHVLAFSFFLTI